MPARPPVVPIEAEDVARVLGAGVPLLVGRIHVDLATGSCSWSPEVEIMHGARTRRPTLASLHSSLHPDDQERVAAAVVDSARRGRPFAAAHRVVDTHGRTRTIVVVTARRSGTGRSAEGGSVDGAVVDVTPAQREALDRERFGVVSRAMVERAAVERVLGAVMVLTGVDDDEAARLLHDAAHRAGVTPAEAAEQVLAALVPAVADPQAVTEALDGVHTVARHDAALLARRQSRAS
ncbi:ANTAR domain protein with unknown sensor [Xylanimonas cellulosilytica DSM 15894]|uniref:ANTAR domain-containing protein n=1 Tax=Xylanimonas cellulosilytica (strain DSM 15894 / JCM 12276 / CECT 5975 / KCTC 9989 / LMG 20990 / NBRC 107835 / XIL07) TaxID=446471 RepID=D1BRH9_XYLCX|nr:ANTAR domain-containing protein [Xylanimonas cellulosilytica]ACZ30434.1 ANTAR domain protein with unknown sensor [Xylanimonas cellulosilytica DSM 15894]